MPAKPTRYAVVPTKISGPGRLYVQVGTYLEKPRDTIVLDVLDASGRRIRHCVFPPSSYTDNGQLPCELPDISRARRLVVTRVGKARIALYTHDKQAGFLIKNEATSLGGRVSTVLSRVGVPLPGGMGGAILTVGLFGSVMLSTLALLLCVPLGRAERRSRSDGSDSSDSWIYAGRNDQPADLHEPRSGHHPHHQSGHAHDQPDSGTPHHGSDQHHGSSDSGHHSSGDSGSSGGDSGGGGGDSGGGGGGD
jgi:uncharacterized membrane protein YgcG